MAIWKVTVRWRDGREPEVEELYRDVMRAELAAQPEVYAGTATVLASEAMFCLILDRPCRTFEEMCALYPDPVPEFELRHGLLYEKKP